MAEIAAPGAIQAILQNIRRAICCSTCHEEGHNKATCPQNPNYGQPRQPRQRIALAPQGRYPHKFLYFLKIVHYR